MTDPGSPLFDFLRIMAILGGILLLAWSGLKYWLLPRTPGIRGLRSGLVEVVARQQLDPRNTLYVVRAGDEHLLLSASDTGGVTLLREMQIVVPVAAASAVEKESPAPVSFAERLRRLQGKATS